MGVEVINVFNRMLLVYSGVFTFFVCWYIRGLVLY